MKKFDFVIIGGGIVGSFASDGSYYMPSGLSDEMQKDFHPYMLAIQINYNNLITKGVKIEDARGILPLNIHSPIHMTINFRNLITMMEQRLCGLASEEF